MPANAQEIVDAREALNPSASVVLNDILERNRATQIRREIGTIADHSFRENLISEAAFENYRKLAEGREEREISAEMLEKIRTVAKEYETSAIRIHRKIQIAIRQGIASEVDEEHLMKKWVIENIDFAGQSNEIERKIDQKLANLKREKGRYDKLANHKLIKDIGYLKIDKDTRIDDFPSEEKFLAMTVPKRRKLLEKFEKALPQAEIYAKEHENQEDEELTEAYVDKLDKAREKGIIGEHTYNEFLNEFSKIDHEKKEYWLSEFDAQMERYKDLWKQIRATLRGGALETMEAIIDDNGFTELFNIFGQMKASEAARLSTSYVKALEEYREQGIIGRHTMAKFMVWMGQQDLADKYEAEEKLPDQMIGYEDLWEKIGELPKKQQAFLRSKIDEWGYTQLNQQYQKFADGTGESAGIADSELLLSQIRSKEVREKIREADEIITEQGKEKRGTVNRILDKMYRKVRRNDFDAKSYQQIVRDRAAEDNPHLKRDSKGRGADDEVDFEQIDSDTEILEESGKAKVKEDQGFIQIESQAADGGTHRETQVTINEERGMERFLAEDSKHNYRAEEAGGNDDLSLAVYTDSGRTVELDLHEVRILEGYLKKKEQEERLDKTT